MPTFFQLRRVIPEFRVDQLPDDAPHPRPTWLTARYLTAPHWNRTYLCSLTPSLRLDFFEYDFEWAPEDDPSDEVREWYSSYVYELGWADSCEYHDWYRICAGTFDTPEEAMTFREGWRVGPPTTYEIGDEESAEDVERKVYEHEQGNWRV